jgi:hypothetical protein
MKFLLLLHGDAEDEAALTADERRAIVHEHAGFSRQLAERGAILVGEALEPPETARTIRMDGDRPIVTDGPFLETKEALGGFYVIEADSMDAATEMVKLVPRSPGLVAELRPIADM